VIVGPSDTAQFREVAVLASPMLADHAMAMGHDASTGMTHEMSMAPSSARDGQTFSQQSAVTPALFNLAWGDRAH
jgi:hypothetical protein